MLKKFLLAALALALLAAPLHAQQASRGFIPDVNGTFQWTCGGASTAVALPGTGPIVVVTNTGLVAGTTQSTTADAFVALGSATVVAQSGSNNTITNGTPVPAGSSIWLTTQQATSIACVTLATNITMRITTGIGNPNALAQISNITNSLAPAPGTPGAGYPPGATPVSNAATGTTAGATATLPAAAGKFTYICGFGGAVGSATTAITINFVMTAASTFTLSAGAPVTAVGVTGPIVTQNFTPCVPASAVNTTITVTAGALGAGGVNQDVNAWGFQQ